MFNDSDFIEFISLKEEEKNEIKEEKNEIKKEKNFDFSLYKNISFNSAQNIYLFYNNLKNKNI